MELSTGKILEENLVQSVFHQTLGEEFPFQRDNPLSGGKQTELGFPLGFCLCLAPFCLFFILKNSPVLNDYKHTHNIVQPPLCLKICRLVLSILLDWICPKYKTLHSGQKMYCFANCFTVLLECLVANRMHVLEYLYSL